MAISIEDMLPRESIVERGWTLTMIRDLLGDEDKLKENPHNSRSNMYLYYRSRVVAVEKTQAFAAAQALARTWSAKIVAGLAARHHFVGEQLSLFDQPGTDASMSAGSRANRFGTP
jgi:hypothetical protein